MMIGAYIGQYRINALTYFFITRSWSILVRCARHVDSQSAFVASVPAVCGLLSAVCWRHHFRLADASYWFPEYRAQDADYVSMLLSMVMVFCNYVNVEWMIIGFMALAFFRKGIARWAAVAQDTAPKEHQRSFRRLALICSAIFQYCDANRDWLHRWHHRFLQRRVDSCRRTCPAIIISYLVLVGVILSVLELKPS